MLEERIIQRFLKPLFLNTIASSKEVILQSIQKSVKVADVTWEDDYLYFDYGEFVAKFLLVWKHNKYYKLIDILSYSEAIDEEQVDMYLRDYEDAQMLQ